jgi:ribose transport system ATP-binding protein
VRVAGKPLRPADPRGSIAAGLAFVTENRRDEGLLMGAPISENIGLVAMETFARPFTGRIERRRLQEVTAAKAAELRIKASSYHTQSAKSLSGGNQQKVVIAKWLLARPQVLLVDEPTRGIDVGAKYEVYAILGELARQGSGVLFISSEVDELLGVADRVVVMNRGEIVGTFERDGASQEQVMRAAFRQEQGVRAS